MMADLCAHVAGSLCYPNISSAYLTSGWLSPHAADGNEGGRHQLIKATVSEGKLWVLLVRCGDKRWFKGVKKEAVGVFDSFIVA